MWVWEPLFEWTRQTRTYWSHWSACSGLNFTLPCATDITHTRVVGLSKYFTSHSVQLFDPDESPRLWEWDAEWGSAVSPRGDVFKLDVKKRRLPFVQLPTVQETFFFFFGLFVFSCNSLFPCVASQTQWTTAIRGQFAEISRQLRHISAKARGGKQQTTILSRRQIKRCKILLPLFASKVRFCSPSRRHTWCSVGSTARALALHSGKEKRRVW